MTLARLLHSSVVLERMKTTSRRREPASSSSLLEIERGSGPFVATSLHAAHEVRQSLLPNLALGDADRLREEDPFTEVWTAICPTRVIPRRSRFEVDFNRPPSLAVYLNPEDAWGLRVWHEPLDDRALAKTMREYRAYYAEMLKILNDLERRYGKFVVLDLHSYNHRREGAMAPPADPELNPEVNVGTGSMNRNRWARLVDRFIHDLREFDFFGRRLDVRENVRFQGGYLCRWVHEQFPVTGCALAIEFKKFFMDEWTGEADPAAVVAIREALASTLPGVREELAR